MKKQFKKIPEFETEEAEREFWSKNDSTDFIDWSKSEKVILSNLKPSTRSISIRLSEDLLHKLKLEANRRDVPYQSLIKVILTESVRTRNIAV